MATLPELSNLYAKKQPHQVDYLTENAPLLAMFPFEKASHGLWNAYEEIKDVKGASFVEMDAPLPTVSAESELKQFSLQVMGGQIEVGEDKAKMFGGAAKYFATKMPAVLRKSGQSAESAILHDTIRAYAIATGNVIEPADAAGDANYTILCVRFVSGETTGLYSPDGFKNGATLDAMALNSGALYKNEDGINVYGMRLKGYFGFQIANPKTVSAIVNVKKTKQPTADQLDELIEMARGTSGSTYIMCHPAVKSMLYKLKNAKMTTVPNDKNINNMIEMWNDIPILTSYNFANGTEVDVAI